MTGEEMARRAMAIAAGLCIYTNDQVTLESLGETSGPPE